MKPTLTEQIQRSRLVVVDVDGGRGRLRVRDAADACSDVACSEATVVLTDEGQAGLGALNPGDIVKIEHAAGRPDTIVVLRRAWEELASPEV